MSFIEQIRSIIGVPPDDLQALEYIVAAVVLIMLLQSALKLINSLFHIGR